MNPEIIAHIWQAMGALSDAQEFLGDETFTHLDLQTRTVRANDHINHAKRHLMEFIQWSEQNDPNAFLAAIGSSLTCTLGGAETHEEKGEGE